jgi:hypothetical protein
MRAGVLVATAFIMMLVGCSGSTTTVTQIVSVTATPAPTATGTSSPATTGCFHRAKILQLGNEWKNASQQLVELRTTDREIALELARATAGDPVVSHHFRDAAGVYGRAPAYKPNNVSPEDLNRALNAAATGAEAMSVGIHSLSQSSVPFC